MKSKVFVLTGIFALVMTYSVFADLTMDESASVMAEEGTEAAEDMGATMGEGMEMMAEEAAEEAAGTEAGNKICPIEGSEIGKMGPAFKVAHNGKVY